jgi:hypothetical protein
LIPIGRAQTLGGVVQNSELSHADNKAIVHVIRSDGDVDALTDSR